MRFITFLLFIIAMVQGKHYILYSKPASELYIYDSYFCSKHLCSTDFAMQLRNGTKTHIREARTNSSM